MVLMALEEADTRSWQTLPARNTLVRLPLEPGTRHLTIEIDSGAIDLPPVTLRCGRRRFYMVRIMDRFSAVYGRSGGETDTTSN